MVKDKIAILGASGFIGMHLCQKLVDKNLMGELFKVMLIKRMVKGI